MERLTNADQRNLKGKKELFRQMTAVKKIVSRCEERGVLGEHTARGLREVIEKGTSSRNTTGLIPALDI